MTPMIDVVFQLLIFFIVTLRQDDLFSRLTAARPQAAAMTEEEYVPLTEPTPDRVTGAEVSQDLYRMAFP